MLVNRSLDTIITNGWEGWKQQDGGSWGIKCPEFVRHLQKHAICWAGNCKQNRLSQLSIHLWHPRMPALVVWWQLSVSRPPGTTCWIFQRRARNGECFLCAWDQSLADSVQSAEEQRSQVLCCCLSFCLHGGPVWLWLSLLNYTHFSKF